MFDISQSGRRVLAMNRGVKLTTRFHLVTKLMVEVYVHCPYAFMA
jgi:hypothetical protein